MEIKFSEILEATRGRALGPVQERQTVRRVSTDSRLLEKGDAFFALIGDRFDGHDFIAEVLSKGAACVIVSDEKRVPPALKKDAGIFVVEDTLRAYGDLAAFYRQQFKIPVIAITGSSGKTTVKELVAQVLSTRFRVLKNRGTENNLVGVPKTLLQIEETHEVAVLELGTNRPGEIDRLASLVRPEIGVLTHIGHSHLEGLGSIQGVREEKLRLLHHLERGGLLLLNGTDPLLQDAQSGAHKVFRLGFSKDTDELAAKEVWSHENGSAFSLDGDARRFETPLVGRHNIVNCLFAVMIGRVFGIEDALIQGALAEFKPVPGRLNMKSIADIVFLDDSYNSNPSSFRVALETLKSFKIRGKKGVVCGDMLELGAQSEALHRQLGSLIAASLFDFVIAAGPQSAHLVDEVLKAGYPASRIEHAKDASAAGALCRQRASAGDMVLVKGSRGMQMERVFECFITSSTR